MIITQLGLVPVPAVLESRGGARLTDRRVEYRRLFLILVGRVLRCCTTKFCRECHIGYFPGGARLLSWVFLSRHGLHPTIESRNSRPWLTSTRMWFTVCFHHRLSHITLQTPPLAFSYAKSALTRTIRSIRCLQELAAANTLMSRCGKLPSLGCMPIFQAVAAHLISPERMYISYRSFFRRTLSTLRC